MPWLWFFCSDLSCWLGFEIKSRCKNFKTSDQFMHKHIVQRCHWAQCRYCVYLRLYVEAFTQRKARAYRLNVYLVAKQLHWRIRVIGIIKIFRQELLYSIPNTFRRYPVGSRYLLLSFKVQIYFCFRRLVDVFLLRSRFLFRELVNIIL